MVCGLLKSVWSRKTFSVIPKSRNTRSSVIGCWEHDNDKDIGKGKTTHLLPLNTVFITPEEAFENAK